MDAESVRQQRMGLEWFFLVRVDTGLYRIIGWIVLYYRLDHIVSSSGSYCIGWVGSYCIGWIRKHWLLCAGWLLAGWDGWTGWGVGATGVGQTDVSTRRNGSATMGSITGAPPMALEGRWEVGSGGWNQLCSCCKVAEYFLRAEK